MVVRNPYDRIISELLVFNILFIIPSFILMLKTPGIYINKSMFIFIKITIK